jgi:hypothetical protein
MDRGVNICPYWLILYILKILLILSNSFVL